MQKTYELSDGSKVTVDDEVSLLGPSPNLIGTSAESGRDMKFQPIRFHAPVAPMPAEPSGYSNPIDSPEFKALWGHQ